MSIRKWQSCLFPVQFLINSKRYLPHQNSTNWLHTKIKVKVKHINIFHLLPSPCNLINHLLNPITFTHSNNAGWHYHSEQKITKTKLYQIWQTITNQIQSTQSYASKTKQNLQYLKKSMASQLKSGYAYAIGNIMEPKNI